MISVSKLTKRYGDIAAVNDLSFEVDKGEVVGFLGPNGAGKSTTLRILAGFLGQTSGKVEVGGHDIAADSIEARRSIGYMPEAVPLYPEMRVVEYLAFRAELKRVARAKRARRRHGDGEGERRGPRDVVIGNLSKGYRQRVGLADALVASPPLLILDEPTAGLDPNQIREVRDVIRELGKEHTVLLSTHILERGRGELHARDRDREGKLVAEGSIDELRRMRRAPALVVIVRGDAAKAEATLNALEAFAKIAVESDADVATLRCAWKKKVDAPENTERAVAALVAAGLAVRRGAPEQSTLEDVFAELTDEKRPTT